MVPKPSCTANADSVHAERGLWKSLFSPSIPSVSTLTSRRSRTKGTEPGTTAGTITTADTAASVESVRSGLFDLRGSMEEPASQPGIFQRHLRTFRPVSTPRLSLAERRSIDAVHTGRTSKILRSATETLVLSRNPSHAQLSGRSTGTVCPETFYRPKDEVGNRDLRILDADRHSASWSRRTENNSKPVYVAPAAAAMHRALQAEWDDGAAILRSLAVRALDMTCYDKDVIIEFFTVTELLTTEYLAITEILLGNDGLDERVGHREAALEALEQFHVARDTFHARRDPDYVDNLVARGIEARDAVLLASEAESRGVGRLADVKMADLANELSKTEGGPFLVLMLARGLAGSVEKGKLWAKSVLFPKLFHKPRPFFMQRLAEDLRKVHSGHVEVFQAAEREYRAMYAKKGVQNATEVKGPGTLELSL